MTTSFAKVIFALGFAYSASSHAQYALFGRHTDTIDVPGQTVVDDSATFEARVFLPKGAAHGGFVFNEWVSGQEEKRLWIGPNQIMGNTK